MSKRYKTKAAAKAPAKWTAVLPWLAMAVFFLVVCWCVPSSSKGVTMVCGIAGLAAGVFCIVRRPGRLSLPLAALALVVAFAGISTLYAVSGKFALSEFMKVATAFSLTLLLLAFTGGEGAAPGRRIAALLARCSALAGLVSIDLLSTRVISGAVLSVLRLFTSEYDHISGVEEGVRMTSLFLNPNVFAACMAIGVLLSLGLVLSSEKTSERMTHLVCLFLNALSFVLAFSMGAIGIIVAAFLIYLILEFKERRAALFVLMAETLAVTAVAMVPISMTSLTAWDGIRVIPLLCVIVGAAALCLLDKFVGQRVANRLAAHGKVLLVIIVGVLAAMLAFVLAAMNLTGPATLSEGESLRRSAYPQPGEYTVTAVTNGAVTVTVESQNRQDTMMHTSTVLYRGDLSEAAFTVPGDSMVVYFNFKAADGAVIESVTYESDSHSGSVPLGYKLLPGFIANRLQGLRANQNAIQRTVFFEDGMKLFRQNPLLGRGLGGYQNGIKSVQSFYYQTKYAHNHYIQTLRENGVVGLVLFALLLLVSAAAVVLARRKENAHPLTGALGAVLVFMAGHAAVEVDFSYYSFLPLAFAAFGLIGLCCGDAIPAAWMGKKVKTCFFGAVLVVLAAFLVLLGMNLRARAVVSQRVHFDTLAQAVKLDKYEWADYAASYLKNIELAEGDSAILAQADEYAARMSAQDSNTAPFFVARYYFETGRPEQALPMLVKYVDYVASDADGWNSAFALLIEHWQDTDVFRDGAARLKGMLEDWNAANMGSVRVDQEVQDFLARQGI